MPRILGTLSDPGRDSARLRNREAELSDVDVMEKRFNAQAAPSGAFDVTGGIQAAMMLLRGSVNPSMPLNLEERGSESTYDAAAGWTQ